MRILAVIIAFAVWSTATAQSDDARYYVKPEIYRVTWDTICQVASPEQLRVFNARDRVQDIPEYANIFSGKRDIGTCPWPEGFYRYPAYPGVFRVHGNSKCTVTSRTQLNVLAGTTQVTTIEHGPNPFTQLKDSGACQWPGGFYSEAGRGAVYMLSEDGACLVANPLQLRLLNGRDKINYVEPSAKLFAGVKDQGVCGWPDGFYQLPSGGTVYFIKGNTICAISTPQKLNAMGGRNRVHRLPGNADIFDGKRSMGVCR